MGLGLGSFVKDILFKMAPTMLHSYFSLMMVNSKNGILKGYPLDGANIDYRYYLADI